MFPGLISLDSGLCSVIASLLIKELRRGEENQAPLAVRKAVLVYNGWPGEQYQGRRLSKLSC